MQGLNVLGDPFIDPLTGQPTKFWHPGDPITGAGWVDTLHNDSRFLMSSGPFHFADGDTQEVSVGIIIAQGETWRESVRLLKQRAALAQTAYETNFAFAPPPPPPRLTIYPETESLLLTWDEAGENYRTTDRLNLDQSGNPTVYSFQGYNVYQLDKPTVEASTQIKKIAVFDRIDGITRIRDDVFLPSIGQVVNMVVQEGKDTGVQRFLRITEDFLLQPHTPLQLHKPYYFAVSAYAYNPLGAPKTLESPLQPVEARPHDPPLGTQLTAAFGDTLRTIHTGASDGVVNPLVLAPAALTGHSYEVRFRNTVNGTVYDVWDATTHVRVDSNRAHADPAAGSLTFPMVDGVLVMVNGPAFDFKKFECIANATGPLIPPEGAAPPFQGFPTSNITNRQQVGKGRWMIETADVGAGVDFHYFVGHTTDGGSRWRSIAPFDYEWRFTSAGGYAYDPFYTHKVFRVPFELWNIGIGTPDDVSDDYRMIPYVLDDDSSGTFNMPIAGSRAFGRDEHAASSGNDDPYTDWVYWAAPDDRTAGPLGYQIWEAAARAVAQDSGEFYNRLAKDDNMRHMVLINWNGGATPPFTQDLPETGTIFRITTTKPNSPADTFRFATPAQVKNDLQLARQQASERVNVFPNPYSRNLIDLDNPYDQFVTFTHLPETGVKIHIYTLSAELVRKIEHDNGTPYEQWNLLNAAGRPVASGIYLARIDMADIGVKLLKLVIF
jgi:hypothetical protein